MLQNIPFKFYLGGEGEFLVENKLLMSALKGQCRYWPRGPEVALTFLRNEFIVKL